MNHEITVYKNDLLGESYTKIAHESGLAIYVFPKKLSSAYAIFATRYGAADNCFRLSDTEPFTVVPDGIAHFLEHKMFENENGEDAFFQYAKTGANANAFTSSHSTAYLFSCTENFCESLAILLDMVTHPYFTDATVEKEKGIIEEEIRMGEDNPHRALYYGMIRALYHANNIRLNVAGTAESIAQITPSLLYRCHEVFYNLHNMALFVCGDVTPEEVVAVADAHLKKALPQTIERLTAEEPHEVVSRRFYTEMQVAKPLFAIGLKDTDISTDPCVRVKKQYAVDILDDILFSRASDFYTELYGEGLISASTDAKYAHCSAYSYHVLSGESPDPEEVYRRYTAYISRMQKQGVDADAFERCKRVQYAHCIAAYDDTEEIAHALMDTVFDDELLFDEPELIDSITLEDVNRVLCELFCENATVMAVVAPLRKESEETL